MEKYFASFPRYGKLFSTVWKTRGNASARAIPYPILRTRNPAPGFMKEQNKAFHLTAHNWPSQTLWDINYALRLEPTIMCAEGER